MINIILEGGPHENKKFTVEDGEEFIWIRESDGKAFWRGTYLPKDRYHIYEQRDRSNIFYWRGVHTLPLEYDTTDW